MEAAAGRVSGPRLGKQERWVVVVGRGELQMSLSIFFFKYVTKSGKRKCGAAGGERGG